jgi:hypothetical protein
MLWHPLLADFEADTTVSTSCADNSASLPWLLCVFCKAWVVMTSLQPTPLQLDKFNVQKLMQNSSMAQ